MNTPLLSKILMMKYRCPSESDATMMANQIDATCKTAEAQRAVIEELILVLDDGYAPELSRLKAVEFLLSIGLKDNDPGALKLLLLWLETPVAPTDALTERIRQACNRIKIRWADGTE